MRPHRRQPTRLPRPWDFPGKNTGVGAIAFSNAWKWKVKVKLLSRVQLFVTLWTAAYQAPPPTGFSRQEYWSGVPLPSPSSWLDNSTHESSSATCYRILTRRDLLIPGLPLHFERRELRPRECSGAFLGAHSHSMAEMSLELKLLNAQVWTCCPQRSAFLCPSACFL